MVGAEWWKVELAKEAPWKPVVGEEGRKAHTAQQMATEGDDGIEEDTHPAKITGQERRREGEDASLYR